MSTLPTSYGSSFRLASQKYLESLLHLFLQQQQQNCFRQTLLKSAF